MLRTLTTLAAIWSIAFMQGGTPAGGTAAAPPRSAPAPAPAPTPASASQVRTWTVDGVERRALVYVPATAKDSSTPVVFGFHGHGGNARNAARMFRLHEEWPEAIVVYMQGLPTPGMTDPKGEKNGWQKGTGDQGDRDLKFFDAVLATLRREYKVDDLRIYATGHSNGGAFTYLLWVARADVFAAFAPSAAGTREAGRLVPKPAMHIAGRNDELVPFAYQERMMASARRTNQCEEKGTPWGALGTLYPSKEGAPFVEYVHDGTHAYPREAPAVIVKFFKENARPAPTKPG